MRQQRGDRAYAIVYDYRADGTPAWYIAPDLNGRLAAVHMITAILP